MNERLVMLTLGTAVDDAVALNPGNDDFLCGFVWAQMNMALTDMYDDMFVMIDDDDIIFAVKWIGHAEFTSYPIQIIPTPLKPSSKPKPKLYVVDGGLVLNNTNPTRKQL